MTYDYGFRIYDPRIIRFLSVDPLMKDYPSWSPYPFAMNRAIDGVDLDGLEWKPNITKDENGNTVINVTIDIIVINKSKEQSDAKMAAYLQEGSAQVSESFTGVFELNGKPVIINTQLNIVAFHSGEEAKNIKLDPNKHFYMEIRDDIQLDKNKDKHIDIYGKVSNTDKTGSTKRNRIQVNISEGCMSVKQFARTFAHEIGHTARLRHPWERLGGGKRSLAENDDSRKIFEKAKNQARSLKIPVKSQDPYATDVLERYYEYNLMHKSGNPQSGTVLKSEQLQKVSESLQNDEKK